jgi:hypothetical protein
MKGWHKHGVCEEAVWPWSDAAGPPRLTPQRQRNALARPLGNYFRVRHLHLPHMHSALTEAGILYASGAVHWGWNEVDPQTGQIPYHSRKAAGHAFAIIGYNDTGFWIQNSWGAEWGLKGFALLSYEDWLENGWDCWVARLGVPASISPHTAAARFGRAATFEHVPHQAIVNSEIQRHLINLGNDGCLSQQGRYQTAPEDVDEILYGEFADRARHWRGGQRLMLYAHGGLNDEKRSASRIAGLRPFALQNEIYPLHFMWETGLPDTIRNIVSDAFRNRRFGGIWDDVKQRFYHLANEAIELATRPLGRAVWGEMRENARLASVEGGGADFLAGRLAQYQLDGNELELHLVGHSAGSILLAHLLPELDAWGLTVKTLTLLAPACSIQLFRSCLPLIGPDRCVQGLTIFNLDETHERGDSVLGIYNQSLLYLVSEAFETRQKTPLLGIDQHLREDRETREFLGPPVSSRGSTVIYSVGPPEVRLRSASTTHAGFDNDADTLNSMFRIITGGDGLKAPVGG